MPDDITLDPSRQLIGWISRHGQTILNKSGCWRGWENPPLDEVGLESAEKLGHWLSYEYPRVGRIVCSDLTRAVQTAEIIMQGCNPECVYLSTDPNLRPWNIPLFAGKEKTPERVALLRGFISNPDVVVPDGESLNQFRDRNDVIFQYLAVPYKGLPTLVVAHTSNIVAAMRRITEINDESEDEEVDDIVGPGGLVAVYCNSAGHLDLVPVLGVEYTNTPEAS
jgi:probable phosphoglycerate mutase